MSEDITIMSMKIDAVAENKEVTDASRLWSRAAVDTIVQDLRDRRGLRQAWDEIDEDIQEHIKKEWELTIRQKIEAPIRTSIHIAIKSEAAIRAGESI